MSTACLFAIFPTCHEGLDSIFRLRQLYPYSMLSIRIEKFFPNFELSVFSLVKVLSPVKWASLAELNRTASFLSKNIRSTHNSKDQEKNHFFHLDIE
ncbi:MAG: hypothetical protein C0433_16985 [Cyclobacterium sp.]|nr:hypothetical protein [Cyclobacterium sp.]